MAEQRKQAELAALLGAYLDNELSRAQVDKVEKLLEQSDSARKLLSKLELSRESLRSLPRERAPESLTAGIERELERDLLLGGNDALVESIGHKHLIWRRVTAAAAVLVLCGAIATIVYRVLSPHNSHPISVEESVVVLNTPSASPPMGSPKVAEKGLLADSSPKLRLSDDLESISARVAPLSHFSEPVPAPHDVTLPIYRPVHLVYRSIKADTTLIKLRKLRQKMAIFAPVTRQLSETKVRYVFMCSPDQLRDFLGDIEDELSGELAVRLSRGKGIDVDEPESLTLSGVTAEQVLALAGRYDAQTQWQDVKAMIAAAEPDDPQTMITTSDAVAVAAAKIDPANSVDTTSSIADGSYVDRVVSGAGSDEIHGIKDRGGVGIEGGAKTVGAVARTESHVPAELHSSAKTYGEGELPAPEGAARANQVAGADVDTISIDKADILRAADEADTETTITIRSDSVANADNDTQVAGEVRATRPTMLGHAMKKTSARATRSSQDIMANTAEESEMAEASDSGDSAEAVRPARASGNASNKVMGGQRYDGGTRVEASSPLNDDDESEMSSIPDLIAVIFDLWVPADKSDNSAVGAIEDVNEANSAVSTESVDQSAPTRPAHDTTPVKQEAPSGNL